MAAWIRAVKMERKYSDMRYVLEAELTGATGRLDMEVEGKAENQEKYVSFWLDKMNRSPVTEKIDLGEGEGVGRELRILF